MKQRGAIAEHAERATLEKQHLAGSNEWKEWGFIAGVIEVWLRKRDENPTAENGLTWAEYRKLLSIEPEECAWKDAFLASLVEGGLLGTPNEITLEETKKIIFMQRGEETKWRDELAKQKSPRSPETVAGRNPGKATETTPDQHRARVRVRKSYISPSREGTVTVSAHVEPELKDALKKKFEQSGYDNFNDFLSAGLQSIVEKEPARELKPSAELAAAALEQSRNLEKTISRLTQDLSRATLETPSRSR